MRPTELSDLAEGGSFAANLHKLQLKAMPWLANLQPNEPEPGEPAAQAPGFERPVSKVEPIEWADFIGQDRVKYQLRVKVLASKKKEQRMGHVLLADSRPGVGKTTLARLIAADLQVPIIEMSKAIHTSQLVQIFNKAMVGPDTAAVLFLDEVHELSPKQMDSFLTFMESSGAVETKHARRYYPNVVFVAATTDVGKLRPAFKSRFSLAPIFEAYTDTELAMLVISMADKFGLDLDNDTVNALAGASAGSPRQIRHLIEAASDLAEVEQPHGTDEILSFSGVFRDGLTVDHVNYLAALATMNGGRAGIDVLAARMGRANIDLRRLEHLLFERALVDVDGARVLTPAGHARLDQAQRGEL